MKTLKSFLIAMRTPRKIVVSRGRLIGSVLALTAGLATPLLATPFFFTTGNPNGKLASLSRRSAPGKIETETADDFFLQDTTVIRSATITGLVPVGTPLDSIRDVEVEIYHVFPKDSVSPPDNKVPSRVNSPGDVEIASATRDSSRGTLSFNASLAITSVTVPKSVVNNISVGSGGDGPATGEAVEITIHFTTPIILPVGILPGDQYFFRPEVLVTGGNFLYLSTTKPANFPGTTTPDLQAWIRNSNLAPDWLRIGTDIIGGTTFNMSFSLSGFTVPEAGTPGQANCHGVTISALAAEFGSVDAAARTFGASVKTVQNAVRLFCK